MNPDGARRLVLISFVVSGSVIVYDVLQHGGNLAPGGGFRAVWSIALLFLFMAILADTLPALAGPFAALVTLAILIGRRGALQSIVAVTQKATPSGSTTAPASAAAPHAFAVHGPLAGASYPGTN